MVKNQIYGRFFAVIGGKNRFFTYYTGKIEFIEGNTGKNGFATINLDSKLFYNQKLRKKPSTEAK